MAKEIQQRARFDLIRYANCWEDAEVLCAALNPTEGKRFLSIASAGDNSFSLLAHGAEVVAVDLSAAQLACVELRRAAFRRLKHQEVLKFLGVRECDGRERTYESLRTDLPQTAKDYWAANMDRVQVGFIHTGKFENYFRKFREKVLPLVHSRKRIDNLLQPKSLADQQTYFDQTWNSFRWRVLFRIFFSRFVMGRLGRDPEFFRYVEGSVSARILKCTQHALTQIPTATNPFLTYILTGNYGDALPHYLRPENFDNVRNGLDRLTLFQGPIQDAAQQFRGAGFDGYNLSDIFEYMDESLTHEIYNALLDAANPGARFAYWNMLVPRSAPESLADQVHSHEELGRELLARDQAWFYSAMIVEEKK